MLIAGNIYTECITEYLNSLDDEYRRFLKDELYYNLPLNKEFGERLVELILLVQSAASNDSNLFYKTSHEFLQREAPTNLHIIEMYRVCFEDLVNDVESQLGLTKERSLEVVSQIKFLFEKSDLYHNFPKKPSDNNTKLLKI